MLRKLSIACYIAGAAALGYVGFTYAQAWHYQESELKLFTEVLENSGRQRIVGPPDLGRANGLLTIPRLGISTLVLDGVGTRELKLGAGHIPGTAAPGDNGNVGIAAHRDTFFRRLRDIRADDVIELSTPEGSWSYAVDKTQVVVPERIDVLAPSGEPELTLVTCYPFFYVGPAPKRFIVHARQIASRRFSKLTANHTAISTKAP